MSDATDAETDDAQNATETEADADVTFDDDPNAAERERQAEQGASGVNPDYNDGDDDFVSFDDVTYTRDDTGELAAEDVFVEELDGMARSRPLMKNQKQRTVNPFIDPDGPKDELTDADLAELFDSRLEKPDLTEHPACEDSRVTERFVGENMPDSMQDGCFIAILLASKEYDIVRLMRNELTESEIEMAVRMEQGDEKNETRKRRRQEN